MYIVLGIIILLFIIITIIYYKDKNKITNELKKIEKENGMDKEVKNKKY